jgi:uncharacterized protein (TIGR02679 family)
VVRGGSPLALEASGSARMVTMTGRRAAAQQCAQFLATRPGWPELLRKARKKVEGLGTLGGTVPIPAGSPLLKPAHDLALSTKGGIALVKLSAKLESTRFGVTLIEVLEAAGGPLRLRPEVEAEQASAWESHRAEFYRVAATCDGTDAARAGTGRWLELDEARLHTRCRTGAQRAVDEIALVIRVATYLQLADRTEPLAVVSTRFTGDPKALLPSNAAGRLLLRALSVVVHGVVRNGTDSARERAVLYSAVGLRGDDISSDVTVAGLLGDNPLANALRAGGHAVTLPLATLRALGEVQAWRNTVFVVENRTVFGPLHDALQSVPPERRPTLVCSSGQPTLAVHRLLRSLVDGGACVRYSGDFDVPGLRIAAGLRVALGDAVSFWRMAPADYQFGLEHRPVARPAKALGQPVALGALSGVFAALVPAMRSHGAVVYHESLIPHLSADLLAFASAG